MSKVKVNITVAAILTTLIAPFAIAESSFLAFFTGDKAYPSNTNSLQKVAYRQQDSSNLVTSSETIILSAPPRETPELGRQQYQPIAQYLSTVLQRKVVYKHPGTWGVYRTEMLKGNYDIIFDGPHFNSYRASNLGHNILAKIPLRHDFVVIVKKGNSRFTDIKSLAGQKLCSHAPPNLGTLAILSQFDNPARQPVILNTEGWEKIYKGVMADSCVAGVLPLTELTLLDGTGKNTEIIFQHKTLPNHAWSAGPRLTRKEQELITQALTSAEAKKPTAKLRRAYQVGEKFSIASNSEYLGLSDYLEKEWGYN